MYLNGYGVEKNTTMALKMFEQGAEAGSIQSMTNAGVMYLEQGNRNVSKAIEYFLMAAKYNQTNAIFDLVLLYMQGYNTTKSCLQLLQMMTTIFQHS